MVDDIVQITARDGTSIGARIYRLDGSGPYPALLGAAPYRFDNNSLPASAQFLWRETGPIEWYVEQGYAYVHMDVRGSGRSGGDFEFLGRNDQNDLYEPMAYLIKQGHRLRLEIVNGDSPVTEALWPHYYRPDKIGSDTIHHDAAHPSELILPVSPTPA